MKDLAQAEDKPMLEPKTREERIPRGCLQALSRTWRTRG